MEGKKNIQYPMSNIQCPRKQSGMTMDGTSVVKSWCYGWRGWFWRKGKSWVGRDGGGRADRGIAFEFIEELGHGFGMGEGHFRLGALGKALGVIGFHQGKQEVVGIDYFFGDTAAGGDHGFFDAVDGAGVHGVGAFDLPEVFAEVDGGLIAGLESGIAVEAGGDVAPDQFAFGHGFCVGVAFFEAFQEALEFGQEGVFFGFEKAALGAGEFGAGAGLGAWFAAFGWFGPFGGKVGGKVGGMRA